MPCELGRRSHCQILPSLAYVAQCCSFVRTAAAAAPPTVLPLLSCPAERYGFEMWFVKWCALIMAGFVVAFWVAIIAAMRFFKFERR